MNVNGMIVGLLSLLPLVASQDFCTAVNNTFTVKLNLHASELGYFRFEECGDAVNPTLGMEIGQTYTFLQKDITNYFHPLGFAYFPDGAHEGVDELEPGIAQGTDQSCAATSTCPAPMYFKDGAYLGTYSNQPSAVTKSTGQDNFGLDDYEPLFFHPLPEWSESEFHVQLNFDDTSYEKDIFYFCHIHNMMSGRIKLLQNGQPISVDDVPEIPYDYDVPGTFDETCGTHGLDDWQLPHPECPAEFVCDVPAEGPKKDFADCIDAMNCHMMAGMTTKMTSQSEIALFIHQMIPHHQNAVNMAKTLLHSGALDGCTDVTNDEDPLCVMKVIMYHIINGQNHEIQSMRGVLESLELPASDDCTVELGQQKEDTTQSRALQGVAAGATGVLLGAAAHLM